MWIFRQKSSQILYPPFENLTTRTTIMLNLAWYVGRLYHLAIIGCDFEITNMALAEPNHIKRNLQHTKCVLYAYQLQSYYVFKICYHIMYQRKPRNDLVFCLDIAWQDDSKDSFKQHDSKLQCVIINKSDEILASWWWLCFKSCPNIHYTIRSSLIWKNHREYQKFTI